VGLVIAVILASALILVAVPSLSAGLVLVVRHWRQPPFWRIFVPTALAALVLQYAYALAPFAFLKTREYSWDLLMNPIFGWHLVVVPAVALALWFRQRDHLQPLAAALVAGLLVSTAAIVILAVPLAFALIYGLPLAFRP
jgi:hypothetical protein